MRSFSHFDRARAPNHRPPREPTSTPSTAAPASGGFTYPCAYWIGTDATAVTPIMSELVAAATRMGTPHHAVNTGTLRMPPPMPNAADTLPATNDTNTATGRRRTL